MSLLEAVYNYSPIYCQTFMLNVKAYELYLERYGKPFRKLFSEFDKNQWKSYDELLEWQGVKLHKIVKHAYESVPYYSEAFNRKKIVPDDILSVEDINKLPILTKEDIKSNYKNLFSRHISKRKIRYGHTSGTTGTPLNVAYDIETCVVHHVADWRQKSWAGLEYGQPYASLQGRMVVPISQKSPPFWRKNYINNQLFLSSFHLSVENLAYYFEQLAKDNIKFIEGYPSNLYILALYLNKKDITFPLKAALTSSETLFQYQREAIEKAFSCKVFDFYGMAERTVFATECECHEGHHLNLDYGITEFVDEKKQPAQTGKLAKIVSTSLHNFAMPMIRYQTNDSCSLSDRACRCGRSFPLMDEVATKNEAIISLSDGRLVSPSVLTHPFKPMDNIIESQIIQEEIDLLRIKIVKNEKYSNRDEKALLVGFAERLGDNISIEVEYVDAIQRTKNGKFRWVISKVKPIF